MTCHEPYDLQAVKDNRDSDGIPKCPKCGGMLKPDVVLYEEPLDNAVMHAEWL